MSKELTVSVDLQRIVVEKMLPFKEQIAKWKEEANLIIVDDVRQTELIKKSAVARKTLTTIRTSIEKVRKELKSDSLNYGRFIDKIAGDITDEVTPLEAHYRANEEFAEREELKKQEALKAERMVIINEKGISGFEIGFNLGTATDKQFEDFIAFKEFEAKKKLEEEALAEKKKEEEAKELEQGRRYNNRVYQLIQIGFMQGETEFKHKDIEAELSDFEVKNDSEDDWSQKMIDVTSEIVSFKFEQDKERQRLSKLQTERTIEFNKYYTPTGLKLPTDIEFMSKENFAGLLQGHKEHYETYTKNEKERLEKLAKEKADEEAFLQKERDKKEAAEKLTQGSDMDKCTELFTLMSGFMFPELRSAKGKAMMKGIHSQYDDILRQIQEFIDSK